MQSFLITTDGPFVIPPNAINPKITIWGGGGGGGGAGAGTYYYGVDLFISAGGGGGAGSYIIRDYPVVPQTIEISIGAGGAGGIGQNNITTSTEGGAGRASVVKLANGTLIYALGGAGGNNGLVRETFPYSNVAIYGSGGVNFETQIVEGYTEFGGRGGGGDSDAFPAKNAPSGNYRRNRGGNRDPVEGGGGGGGAGFNGDGGSLTNPALPNSGAGGHGGSSNMLVGNPGGDGGSGGVLVTYYL